MQVPGRDNAGPGSGILGLELMSEGIETLLEKKKASGMVQSLINIQIGKVIQFQSLSVSCFVVRDAQKDCGTTIE